MSETEARRLVAARSGILVGMAFMAVAAFSGTVMTVLIRQLSFTTNPFVMAFCRATFGFIVLGPWVLRRGFAPLKTRRLGVFVAYGALLTAITLFFFTSLGFTTVATVTALSFSMPLFAAALAILFFREPMRLDRVAALVVGLGGTLVILRPGFVGLDFGSMMALAGSAAGAIGILVVKVLVRTESSLTITVYTSLMAMPFSFVLAVVFWQTPTPVELLLLFALGACGSLTHYCHAQAYRLADVTAVMPVDFTRLVWAAVLGYLAFAESPDLWTWLGGVLIFAAAFGLAYRQRRG